MNPVDVTGFSSPFNVDLAVNARNKADAYTKSQAALRAGSLGGAAASFIGPAQGQKFMDKAGAYAHQQAQNAKTFGNFADLAGGLGAIGVTKGFGNLFGSGSGFSSIDAQTMGMPTGQADFIAGGGTTEWTTDMPINSWQEYQGG